MSGVSGNTIRERVGERGREGRATNRCVIEPVNTVDSCRLILLQDPRRQGRIGTQNSSQKMRELGPLSSDPISPRLRAPRRQGVALTSWHASRPPAQAEWAVVAGGPQARVSCADS